MTVPVKTKKITKRKRRIKMAEKKSNVDKILEEISNLTVIELSDLVSAMEEKFGVTAQAPVAVAAAGVPGAEGGAAEEKTEFDVVLQAAGDKKIQVIKVVRELTGLGLKEAKALVDEAPKPVKEGVDKETAEEVESKLEEQGATVAIN